MMLCKESGHRRDRVDIELIDLIATHFPIQDIFAFLTDVYGLFYLPGIGKTLRLCYL